MLPTGRGPSDPGPHPDLRRPGGSYPHRRNPVPPGVPPPPPPTLPEAAAPAAGPLQPHPTARAPARPWSGSPGPRRNGAASRTGLRRPGRAVSRRTACGGTPDGCAPYAGQPLSAIT